MPSPSIDGQKRGYVIPIGGAEEKIDNPEILTKFVELAGGRDANICIVPTASRLEDTGERYEVLFRDLGAGTRHILAHLLERSDAQH